MEIEKIKLALVSSLFLLNSEVDNIDFDDLKKEYLIVIEQINLALKEIKDE